VTVVLEPPGSPVGQLGAGAPNCQHNSHQMQVVDMSGVSTREKKARAKMSLTSEMKNLTTVSDFVTEFARRHELCEDDTFALQTAIDEACANVVDHAYQGKPDGEMHIQCALSDGEVTVTITDRGKPFDPRSVPRPDVSAPLQKRQEGGLGLFLMERLMDSVKFEFDAAKGNRLTMKKKVRHENLPLCPSS
jgi:serine/threonine-protein kinase RsbW